MNEPNTAPAALPAAAAPAADPNAAENERLRIQTIMSLPEAEGRASLARALAFEPGMTPEAAKRILAASPLAPVAAPPNPLDLRMQHVKNPVIGTGDDLGNEAMSEPQRILAMLPNHQKIQTTQN